MKKSLNGEKAGGSRRLGILFLGVLGTVAMSSCDEAGRLVMAPPSIPGAKFVGSGECSDCHDKITEGFEDATHSRLLAKGTKTEELGCESCHGPGSFHVESGGMPHTIINPRRSPETCFQCHLDKRGEFNLPHSHPVLEGDISCADCHNSHAGPALKGGGAALHSEDSACFQCHTAQKGPFVFEHEAMREGCTTCHSPHGSVNDKMLKTRNANLCLQCHFQEQTAPGQVKIGGMNHSFFLPRGACWTAGCHEAVHGSQVNSSLRY